MMPVLGWQERSAAMMGTAPRKKPKGLAAMRSYLMGMRLGTRPAMEARRRSRGSCLQAASGEVAVLAAGELLAGAEAEGVAVGVIEGGCEGRHRVGSGCQI